MNGEQRQISDAASLALCMFHDGLSSLREGNAKQFAMIGKRVAELGMVAKSIPEFLGALQADPVLEKIVAEPDERDSMWRLARVLLRHFGVNQEIRSFG